MEFKQKLQQYAELIVKVGVNLKKDDELYIGCPVAAAELGQALANEAFKAGAKDVIMIFKDEQIEKIRLKNASLETLCNIPSWQSDARNSAADKPNACYISITADDPDLFSDVDGDLMAQVSRTTRKSVAKYFDAAMSNRIRWCVCAAATEGWASRVFPDESNAVSKLWDAIFAASRVDGGDAIAAWNTHNANLIKYCETLNNANIVSFRYKNSIGTDFTVGMPKGYIFTGGLENSDKGVPFTANIPTEEVFSAPHKYKANGTLVSALPLSHLGKLIKDFKLTFKDGKVVDFSAKVGYDTLKGIIETDEGSCYLGEIALISYNTPIRGQNILFMNTLFDENASCHFALGKAYPTCVKNTENLSAKELDELGVNTSLEHVDFMVGTKDLEIDATLANGSVMPIFRNGNFVI